MTQAELVAMKHYINAVIQSRIREAFGRDWLQESITESETEKLLDAAVEEAE